jgi:glycosyltransferase involved in cell wall biosynthesis
MVKDKIRVLYFDNSMAFGGALKSLSLLLHSSSFQSIVEPVVITAQDPEIINAWLQGITYVRCRRLLDYRKKERFGSWATRNIPIKWVSVLARKCFAVLETVETGFIVFRIVWIGKTRHVHVVHANTGFFTEILIAARILNLPQVVHCRGFFAYWDKSTKANLPKSDHVIAVSNAVSMSVQSEGYPKEKVTTIYDPVDTSIIDAARLCRPRIRAELGIRDSQIGVAIFGRVVPWKGQHEFVTSMLNVMQKNDNVLGLIIGDEADDSERLYFPKIKQIINESKFKGRFILAGYRADVEALYAAVDIFVHASIEPEPFGMVVAEAMAAGKAVIAADAGGPHEIILDGYDGILVKPGDIIGFADAILQLSNDRDKREMLGRNASKKVRSFLDVGIVANKTAQIYFPLLNPSRHSP